MKRLLETATAEIEIKKSRFISIAYPVESLEEVKEKVREAYGIDAKAIEEWKFIKEELKLIESMIILYDD